MTSEFIIVTFRLTNEFEVACFCKSVTEEHAKQFALGAINNLKSSIDNVHPALNYIDKNTHCNLETWDSVKIRSGSYHGNFGVYDGACRGYKVKGKGAKTAFMNYADEYLDPKCMGVYMFSRVTVVFNLDKAEWFISMQARLLDTFRYNPENDVRNREDYYDEAITDDMLKKLDSLNNRRAKLWVSVEKLRKSRRADLNINSVINEYENIQRICHYLQNEFDGTSMQEEMAGVAHDVYKLRVAVGELREKALKVRENNKKQFMDEDGDFGNKLLNLFKWK